MATLVPADRSAGAKAGDFGKGLGFDSAQTLGGETDGYGVRADIALSELGTITDTYSLIAATALDAALSELSTYKPLFSTITADTAEVTDTTVTATGLSVTLPIAGTYVVEAFLPYTVSDAAGDIAFKFGGTATVTATVGTSDMAVINAPSGDASAARVPTLIGTSWTTAQSLLTTGTPADASPAFYKGKIVATVAGTIIVSFNNPGATGNTHVGAGAYLLVQRVA